jgi:hypothetical protein
VYNKDTVRYSCEQRWFNLFVGIQAQQDAPTQDKDNLRYYHCICKEGLRETMKNVSQNSNSRSSEYEAGLLAARQRHRYEEKERREEGKENI